MSDYTHDRNAEFSITNITRPDLIEMFSNALVLTESILKKVTTEQLTRSHNLMLEFPGKDIGDIIITVAVHFGYHTGQAVTNSRKIKTIFSMYKKAMVALRAYVIILSLTLKYDSEKITCK